MSEMSDKEKAFQFIHEQATRNQVRMKIAGQGNELAGIGSRLIDAFTAGEPIQISFDARGGDPVSLLVTQLDHRPAYRDGEESEWELTLEPGDG